MPRDATALPTPAPRPQPTIGPQTTDRIGHSLGAAREQERLEDKRRWESAPGVYRTGVRAGQQIADEALLGAGDMVARAVLPEHLEPDPDAYQTRDGATMLGDVLGSIGGAAIGINALNKLPGWKNALPNPRTNPIARGVVEEIPYNLAKAVTEGEDPGLNTLYGIGGSAILGGLGIGQPRAEEPAPPRPMPEPTWGPPERADLGPQEADRYYRVWQNLISQGKSPEEASQILAESAPGAFAPPKPGFIPEPRQPAPELPPLPTRDEVRQRLLSHGWGEAEADAFLATVGDGAFRTDEPDVGGLGYDRFQERRADVKTVEQLDSFLQASREGIQRVEGQKQVQHMDEFDRAFASLQQRARENEARLAQRGPLPDPDGPGGPGSPGGLRATTGSALGDAWEQFRRYMKDQRGQAGSEPPEFVTDTYVVSEPSGRVYLTTEPVRGAHRLTSQGRLVDEKEAENLGRSFFAWEQGADRTTQRLAANLRRRLEAALLEQPNFDSAESLAGFIGEASGAIQEHRPTPRRGEVTEAARGILMDWNKFLDTTGRQLDRVLNPLGLEEIDALMREAEQIRGPAHRANVLSALQRRRQQIAPQDAPGASQAPEGDRERPEVVIGPVRVNPDGSYRILAPSGRKPTDRINEGRAWYVTNKGRVISAEDAAGYADASALGEDYAQRAEAARGSKSRLGERSAQDMRTRDLYAGTDPDQILRALARPAGQAAAGAAAGGAVDASMGEDSPLDGMLYGALAGLGIGHIARDPQAAMDLLRDESGALDLGRLLGVRQDIVERLSKLRPDSPRRQEYEAALAEIEAQISTGEVRDAGTREPGLGGYTRQLPKGFGMRQEDGGATWNVFDTRTGASKLDADSPEEAVRRFNAQQQRLDIERKAAAEKGWTSEQDPNTGFWRWVDKDGMQLSSWHASEDSALLFAAKYPTRNRPGGHQRYGRRAGLSRSNQARTVEAWENGRASQSSDVGGSIWTDGDVIYSYNTPIAWRDQAGRLVLNMEDYSKTTNQHQQALRRYLNYGLVVDGIPRGTDPTDAAQIGELDGLMRWDLEKPFMDRLLARVRQTWAAYQLNDTGSEAGAASLRTNALQGVQNIARDLLKRNPSYKYPGWLVDAKVDDLTPRQAEKLYERGVKWVERMFQRYDDGQGTRLLMGIDPAQIGNALQRPAAQAAAGAGFGAAVDQSEGDDSALDGAAYGALAALTGGHAARNQHVFRNERGVFDPEAIVRKARGLPPKQNWWSRLEDAITNFPQERATPEQWYAHLSKNSALEEREYTGVEQFLKERGAIPTQHRPPVEQLRAMKEEHAKLEEEFQRQRNKGNGPGQKWILERMAKLKQAIEGHKNPGGKSVNEPDLRLGLPDEQTLTREEVLAAYRKRPLQIGESVRKHWTAEDKQAIYQWVKTKADEVMRVAREEGLLPGPASEGIVNQAGPLALLPSQPGLSGGRTTWDASAVDRGMAEWPERLRRAWGEWQDALMARNEFEARGTPSQYTSASSDGYTTPGPRTDAQEIYLTHEEPAELPKGWSLQGRTQDGRGWIFRGPNGETDEFHPAGKAEDYDQWRRDFPETDQEAIRSWNRARGRTPVWRSGHFTDVDNVIEHVRLTERRIPWDGSDVVMDGPVMSDQGVMHIEEVQSDLHEATELRGGYHGTLDPNLEATWVPVHSYGEPDNLSTYLGGGQWIIHWKGKDPLDYRSQISKVPEEQGIDTPEKALARFAENADQGGRLNAGLGTKRPPVTPFSNAGDQVGLGTRRALTEAARRDLENVAYATPEEHYRRYNIDPSNPDRGNRIRQWYGDKEHEGRTGMVEQAFRDFEKKTGEKMHHGQMPYPEATRPQITAEDEWEELPYDEVADYLDDGTRLGRGLAEAAQHVHNPRDAVELARAAVSYGYLDADELGVRTDEVYDSVLTDMMEEEVRSALRHLRGDRYAYGNRERMPAPDWLEDIRETISESLEREFRMELYQAQEQQRDLFVDMRSGAIPVDLFRRELTPDQAEALQEHLRGIDQRLMEVLEDLDSSDVDAQETRAFLRHWITEGKLQDQFMEQYDDEVMQALRDSSDVQNMLDYARERFIDMRNTMIDDDEVPIKPHDRQNLVQPTDRQVDLLKERGNYIM